MSTASSLRDQGFYTQLYNSLHIKHSGKVELDLGWYLGKRNSCMYMNWKMHHARLLSEVKRNSLSRCCESYVYGCQLVRARHSHSWQRWWVAGAKGWDWSAISGHLCSLPPLLLLLPEGRCGSDGSCHTGYCIMSLWPDAVFNNIVCMHRCAAGVKLK